MPPDHDPDRPHRYRGNVPTHPDEVIAASCLRLAAYCDQEAAILADAHPVMAEDLTQAAHQWREAAATHRRRRRASTWRHRPPLRLVS